MSFQMETYTRPTYYSNRPGQQNLLLYYAVIMLYNEMAYKVHGKQVTYIAKEIVTNVAWFAILHMIKARSPAHRHRGCKEYT